MACQTPNAEYHSCANCFHVEQVCKEKAMDADALAEVNSALKTSLLKATNRATEYKKHIESIKKALAIEIRTTEEVQAMPTPPPDPKFEINNGEVDVRESIKRESLNKLLFQMKRTHERDLKNAISEYEAMAKVLQEEVDQVTNDAHSFVDLINNGQCELLALRKKKFDDHMEFQKTLNVIIERYEDFRQTCKCAEDLTTLEGQLNERKSIIAAIQEIHNYLKRQLKETETEGETQLPRQKKLIDELQQQIYQEDEKYIRKEISRAELLEYYMNSAVSMNIYYEVVRKEVNALRESCSALFTTP